MSEPLSPAEVRLRRIMDVLLDGFHEHSSICYENPPYLDGKWYAHGDTRIGGDTDVRAVALAVLREFWPEEAESILPATDSS